MESEAVRRRLNTISSHLATTGDELCSGAAHILSLNCSSSLSSVIRRCDNRTYFARQGSGSQACFMRQVSTAQVTSAQSGASPECSSCKTSPKVSEVPLFSRPVLKCSANETSPPLFSRSVRRESNLPSAAGVQLQPMVQDCLPSLEPPRFARTTERFCGSCKEFPSRRRKQTSNGYPWSPRMDVAEYKHNYILVVELPGVGINDIRVEVNDQKLTVTGKSSTQLWRAVNSTGTFSTYHKREILHGPCKVVWPLPDNVNKEAVSAEFVDGLLQITVPKL